MPIEMILLLLFAVIMCAVVQKLLQLKTQKAGSSPDTLESTGPREGVVKFLSIAGAAIPLAWLPFYLLLAVSKNDPADLIFGFILFGMVVLFAITGVVLSITAIAMDKKGKKFPVAALIANFTYIFIMLALVKINH